MEQIVEKIKAVGRSAPRFTTGLSDADDLVYSDPFAFLLACSLDRGAHSEVIWRIPYHILCSLGHLDPSRLSRMSRADIISLIDRLPDKPRYKGDASITIEQLALLVATDFDGKAECIWQNRSVEEINHTLLSIHGIGPGIANMILNLLHRYFAVGFTLEDMSRIDVKADVHVERVFQRTGLMDGVGFSVSAARQLNAAYPGELDLGAWEIGRRWCHESEPFHEGCPLSQICPRILLRQRGQSPSNNRQRRGSRMATRGRIWNFEDFCKVYCQPEKSLAELAEELDRTPGGIEAVRASMDAVRDGKTTPTFPGAKWEEFIRRAMAGECECDK